MTVVPTEVWENLTGIAIERRALLPDSGGPGEWRGGAGQEVVFRNDTPGLVDVALMGQRTRFAARGYLGGSDGREQVRALVPRGVGLDHQGHHLPALVAKLGAERVILVAREARHHALEVHRDVERLLIDGQVLVARHRLALLRAARERLALARDAGGRLPLHPLKSAKSPEGPNHRATPSRPPAEAEQPQPRPEQRHRSGLRHALRHDIAGANSPRE